MKKIEQAVAEPLKEIKINPENLVNAVVELVNLARSKGFADEARAALSACGITLEIEEA